MQHDSDPNERTMIARRGPMPAAPAVNQHLGGAMSGQMGNQLGGQSGGGRASGVLMPRSPAEELEPQRAPAPPRRRLPGRSADRVGSMFRFLNGLMSIALMVMVATGIAYYAVNHLLERPGPLTHSTVLVIPKGEGMNDIARRMEREGIIEDARVFSAAVLISRSQNKLKAGEYAIPKAASTQQVLEILKEGKSLLYKASFREGLTSQQIIDRLRETEDLTGDIETVPPEGSLLPETYTFARGTNRQDLLVRMQADQQKFIKSLWEKRDPSLPFKSIDDVLIMASIVEKETGRADERDRVAAVFINRLRKGMRLQSDPTIIYGLVGGKGGLGRGLLRSEIDQPTPYNTYSINGLPPTPICNPGKDAILATLNPAQTSDLYFVANGTGGHAFAKSLADHNKNVQAWRQIERDNRTQSEPEATPAAAQPVPNPVPASKQGGKPSAKPPAPAVTPTAAKPAANGAKGAAKTTSPAASNTGAKPQP